MSLFEALKSADDLILITGYFNQGFLQGLLEAVQFFVIDEKIQELRNEGNIN
jgi:hypothetical protein